MLDYWPLLVPLAPLIAAILTSLPRKFISAKTYEIGKWLLALSFFASLPVLWQLIQSPEPIRLVVLDSPWTVLPKVELSIDRLAAIMMTVISSIGLVLYRYSIIYLQQDGSQPRYHTLLALSIASLLTMVASSDLIVLFILWQLLSWLLCLLSHNYAHTPTAHSSFRTFIMLRAGDVAFMSGIALAYHLYGTVQLTPLFEKVASNPVSINLFGSGLEIAGATAITLLIFIGAMAKSAQFPLHMWLPDSLYAPTPIHGLLHAGIINAGGFLINRLAPLYAHSPTTLHVVLIIGLITVLFGKCMMLVKNDIKKTLGYSTIGQMGYMIMECGLGAFSLAVFHLIAHGLFKATVFLNCGDVIHKARMEPERPFKQAVDGPKGVIGWTSGLIFSLFLPLAIIIATHYALGIEFLDHQGMFIFLLFGWVTASHAMLTLFRLEDNWKKISGALVAVAVVSTAYYFGSEQFTHFLYPEHGVVAAYLKAAALPVGAYIGLAAILVLSIMASWMSLYLHFHDKFAIRAGWLWYQLYLFFINRCYLDGFAVRLFDRLKKIGKAIEGSQVALIILIALTLGLVWKESPQLAQAPLDSLPVLIISMLLLPLFPLHFGYKFAITHTPRAIGLILCLALPLAGIFLLPKIPPQLLPAIGVMASAGAIWGSIKALTQTKVSQLISYSGIAFYSVLWWHLAQAGAVSTNAILYAVSTTLVIGGLLFAWNCIRSRYGDLDVNNIGGLFRPMPRFALCLALVIMAGSGLPPFGLFFSYLGILLDPSTGMSLGLVASLLAWFFASWYLFKLMQMLLFGPHRTDIHYRDIGSKEMAGFVLVIALLLVIGGFPHDWVQTAQLDDAKSIGGILWMQ